MKVYSTVNPATLSSGTWCAIGFDASDHFVPGHKHEFRITQVRQVGTETRKEVLIEPMPDHYGPVIEKRCFVSPHRAAWQFPLVQFYRDDVLVAEHQQATWPTTIV